MVYLYSTGHLHAMCNSDISLYYIVVLERNYENDNRWQTRFGVWTWTGGRHRPCYHGCGDYDDYDDYDDVVACEVAMQKE